MGTFAPPFSMRLLGGFRANAFDLPLEPLERIINVRLELADDLELGGAYYSYAPYPPPETGLAGVRLHVNEIRGLGMTNAARPDLLCLLLIELGGDDLLALGRLDCGLEAAYGEVYGVAEYSLAGLGPPGDPASAPQIHWVQFEASLLTPARPRPDTPALDCLMEFKLGMADPQPVMERLAAISEPAQGMRRIDLRRPDGHLTLQFDSRSLLALGRCAEAVESAAGGASKVLGYQVTGDLLRNGSLDSIEHTFG
jgi:hypothetical protein